MLIDATRLPGDRVTARVCIIGSGMGGASVAKRLVEAGLDVLFVEAGDDQPAKGPSPVRHLTAGRSFGLGRTRAFELGGSSNLWHGICAPLDAIDFSARPWIAHSGWPISYDDLAPHYAEALEWLGVAADPSQVTEPPAAVLHTLAGKPFWTARTPARLKEAVLGWAAAGRARCLTHAVALELRADGHGTVRSLVVGAGVRTIEVEAEVFIVAAGGLETPRLLLNSERASAGGFAAGAALAGRFLMDHPVGYFSQVRFHQRESAPFGPPPTERGGHLIGLALRPELQERQRLANHYVFIRPGVGSGKAPNELLRSFLGVRRARDLSPRQFLAVLTNSYVLRRVVRERLGFSAATRYGDIYVMAEQVPNPQSRVTLADQARDEFGYPIAQVDWRVLPDEWDRFGAYFSLVAQGLSEDRRIASMRLDPAEEWPSVLSSAAHHLGTARMGATARDGVVDANLKVFGCNNLFVCDASVFPTGGATNPSLTIAALALRLGGRLARTLAAPVQVHASV